MRRIMVGRGMLIGLALLATAGLSACSANRTPNSAGPGNGRSTTPAATATTSSTASTSPTASAAPAAAASPTPTSGTSLAPMQTAQGGEFLSPSGNIACIVDYNRPGLTDMVYCETGTPSQVARLFVNGSYETCAGLQCRFLFSNPHIVAPTLAYGTATGVGPFVCESAITGVTCTANGRGFRISRSGITPV